MKYWLKDFEHNISPATWEAADELAAAGSVRYLREIEPHFWVANVDAGEESFETEVIITPHKIKAYSCECFSAGRRLMCAHIAASLLKIRQYLEKREEEKRARAEKAQSNELSRITVQSVLSYVPAIELEAFVRDYARRDRDFALALKTWFAGSISEAENPYALVLDSVLPKNRVTGAYRDPDFKRIRKALDGLEVQLNLAETEGNYRKVFQISSAILSKMLPILEKMEGNRKETLLHFCQLALTKITGISTDQLSAELRDAAWESIFDMGNSGLLIPEMHRQAIQFLSDSAANKDRLTRIGTSFDETPHPAPTFLLELFLASLAMRKIPEAVPKVLEDFLNAPDSIHAAILQLYYLKHWDAVLACGDQFLSSHIFQPRQQRELEDIMIYVAEQSKDKKQLSHWLRFKFMRTGNIDAFKKLKEVADKKWPGVRNKLIEELSVKGEIQVLAACFVAEEQWEDLAQLIEEEASIPLLQRYESHFYGRDPKFLQKCYVQFLSRYLDDHFGSPAARQVRHRLAFLNQNGQTDLLLQIAKELLKLYPDRSALPEELGELFPKMKKRNLIR